MKPKFKFDAFISHSHEDKATVEWLSDQLASRRVWWLFKRRRRICVDTETFVAGSLSKAIESSLENSEYLVVCRSAGSADSDHVTAEVAHFVSKREESKVLVANVGEKKTVKFHALNLISEDTRKDILYQDLTGPPKTWEKETLKKRKSDAAAILAALLGFVDKKQLDSRTKVSWVSGLALMAALAVSAAIGIFKYNEYQDWLETPAGLRHQAVLKIREYAANGNEYDDPRLSNAAIAFGVADDQVSVDALRSCVRDLDYDKIIGTCGLLSLPTPKIDEAINLVSKLPEHNTEVWPYGNFLLAATMGTEPDSISSDVSSVVPSIELLCLAGKADFAKGMLSWPMLSIEDRLRANVIVNRSLEDDSPLADELVGFLEGLDPDLALGETIELLLLLQQRDRLDSVAAKQIVPFAIEAGQNADLANMTDWRKLHQLAALLAGAGKPDEASWLLQVTEEWSAVVQQDKQYWDPSSAATFRWRSLAYDRLDDITNSLRYLDLSNQCFSVEQKVTRTYHEVQELAEIHVYWDDWEGAFGWVDEARNERLKFEIRCRLIELWSLKH